MDLRLESMEVVRSDPLLFYLQLEPSRRLYLLLCHFFRRWWLTEVWLSLATKGETEISFVVNFVLTELALACFLRESSAVLHCSLCLKRGALTLDTRPFLPLALLYQCLQMSNRRKTDRGLSLSI